uniref:Chemokine interleukin-8-like domain-containing protein n=1 Tax=Piliocolobus tephrosceles TaxID=591936 RepID=A0A8C9LM63_9PRIM
MSLRLNATPSCNSARPFRALQVLLLLSLLLTALPSCTNGQSKRNLGKSKGRDLLPTVSCTLNCTACVKSASGIHPSNDGSTNIHYLEVVRSGAHYNSVVSCRIMLKDERKMCLDPEAPRIKKIVQKMLEDGGSAA